MAQFGMFGKMFLTKHTDDKKDTRMRHAAWVDMANLALWGVTALWCGIRWWKGRGQAKPQSGRNLKDEEMAHAWAILFHYCILPLCRLHMSYFFFLAMYSVTYWSVISSLPIICCSIWTHVGRDTACFLLRLPRYDTSTASVSLFSF